MKNKSGILLFAGAAFALAAISCSKPKASTSTSAEKSVQTVYAVTGGAPRPFTYVNDKNELVGENIELIQAIFAKLPQYKLVIEKTDFASIFAGLDSDRYQIGVNNFVKTESRKVKYLFSDPIFKNRYVIVVNPSKITLTTIDDFAQLAGKTCVGDAAANVTTSVKEYNDKNPDKQIKIKYTEADLISQLQDVEAGKYDFLIIDKPMYSVYNGQYHFNLKALDVSDTVSTQIMGEPYSYLIVSRGHDQLVQDINKGLAEVIKDGTSKTISEKYFGDDYTPSAQQ
jgi:polar amino acid transport system substrate-binding protein